MNILDCLKMEYRMVAQFLKTPDFLEGVTAKLIDKPPRTAVWTPSLKDANVLTGPLLEKLFFEPNEETNKIKFYSRASYYDYPHRTLSGLPTDRDIKRVVDGDLY